MFCGSETEMLTIASDYPQIVKLLERIDQEEHKHCQELRDADEK
jgi:hypothetical protein